jgi:hypothetical protein
MMEIAIEMLHWVWTEHRTETEDLVAPWRRELTVG